MSHFDALVLSNRMPAGPDTISADDPIEAVLQDVRTSSQWQEPETMIIPSGADLWSLGRYSDRRLEGRQRDAAARLRALFYIIDGTTLEPAVAGIALESAAQSGQQAVYLASSRQEADEARQRYPGCDHIRFTTISGLGEAALSAAYEAGATLHAPSPNPSLIGLDMMQVQYTSESDERFTAR